MSETRDGTPPHNLDSLITSLHERKGGEDARTLAKAALHALGFSESMDGQVHGVLGVQAKHDYRIGQLEAAFRRVERWHWLIVLAGIALVMQTAQVFWDRYAPTDRIEARARPLPPGDR